MKAEIWLKIQGKKRGIHYWPGPISASKSKPTTRECEIAIKLEIEIPDEIFKEPVFEAKLTLPKTIRNFPDLTEIARTIGDDLSRQTGFKIKISAPEPVTEMPT